MLRRILLAIVLALAASPARAEQMGWEYLVDKLVADGVDRNLVVATFDDPRVEPFSGLEFGPGRHRESRALYNHFRRPGTIAAARRCRNAHAEAFEKAARTYGVSADAVAAIIFVESGCGQNTGSSRVFYRLARLAMANEPENLRRNLERYANGDGYIDPQTETELRAKARYLEQTFYPEVRALFDVAKRMGVDPLDIRGSGSGAFGYPQFLPRSYLNYGVDGDGDGFVSLYDVDDAAASCARYLAAYGWHADATHNQCRGAVWQYNHSDAYVDTIFMIAKEVGKPAPPPRKPGKAKSSKTKSGKAKTSKAKSSSKKKH